MTSMNHPARNARLLRAGSGLRSADPLPRLLLQLVARAGPAASVVRATSRPWASALFQGRQHIISLRIEGADAATARQRFAEGFEEAEWALVGHFVADIMIEDVHSNGDSEQIELSALTVEDW